MWFLIFEDFVFDIEHLCVEEVVLFESAVENAQSFLHESSANLELYTSIHVVWMVISWFCKIFSSLEHFSYILEPFETRQLFAAVCQPFCFHSETAVHLQRRRYQKSLIGLFWHLHGNWDCNACAIDALPIWSVIFTTTTKSPVAF